LAYDICNLIGLPSLSANFVKLYFNKRYMGLYTMRDAFKPQWIESTFGEKSTKHIYYCSRNFGKNRFLNCINNDEELRDTDTEFTKFQEKLAMAKTKEDLEEFFDVETFMRWQAYRYLLGSWDHYVNAHNTIYYMNKDKVSGKEKWIPLLYDFDSDMGAYVDSDPKRTFNDVILKYKHPFFSLMNINEKNPEFMKYVDEYMRKGVNPKVMLPRIDSIKAFIDPFIKEDRTPDANGNRPGRVSRVEEHIQDSFTYEDFLKNTEYTTVRIYNKYLIIEDTDVYFIRGLKQWFVERFQFICKTYKFDCSYAEEYLNKNDYKVDQINYEQKLGGCLDTGHRCCKSTTTPTHIDKGISWGLEDDEECVINNDNSNNKSNVKTY